MQLLIKDHYHKLSEPLKSVTINNLFARSVIEQKVNGQVFVDNCENPKTYYVVHPYGMSLLFGETKNDAFNSAFKDYALNVHQIRDRHEWMQAFPENWNHVLDKLFKNNIVHSSDNSELRTKGMIELNTRVNFKFNRNNYQNYIKPEHSSEIKIVRTNEQIFQDMKGNVVPAFFWNSESDFLKSGVGFSLFYKNQLASTAYSACVHEDQLELGIETTEAFRGKGFAELTCSALIDHCLEKNFEPVWACRIENTGSYKLAQKLGFVPSIQLPFYRLSK